MHLTETADLLGTCQFHLNLKTFSCLRHLQLSIEEAGSFLSFSTTLATLSKPHFGEEGSQPAYKMTLDDSGKPQCSQVDQQEGG